MPDDRNIDYAPAVVNPVDDTVILNPNPPKISRTAELLASCGPRVYNG